MSSAFENILNKQEKDRSYLIRDYFGNEDSFKKEVVNKIVECEEDGFLLSDEALLRELMVTVEHSGLTSDQREYLENRVSEIKNERKKRDQQWEDEAKRAGFGNAREYREFLRDNE
ncbi:hypothetical protein ACFL3M_00665 [Patescibacteria group bacterium]